MNNTEKNEKPKFETTETDLKKFDLTVTLSNQLVDSIIEMDAMPQKVYLFAIGHLDPKHPPLDNTVKVSKKALFALMSSSSSSSKHSRLKQVIEKLHQQSVIKIQRTKPNGKTEYKVISPLEITEFNDFSDAVSIKFSSAIMPFLTNLEDHFTQYSFDQVVNLTSKYAISFFNYSPKILICMKQIERMQHGVQNHLID
ncbi:replication initiation protein (plasmid) [Enterococcus faecium]